MSADLSGKIIKIGSSKYRVSRKIAEGSFSQIYEGTSDTHKSSVAIKHLSFKTSQKAAYEAYVKEVAILEEISSHQNIVKLLDKKEAVSDEDIDAILILEYCIQNLSKIIASRRRKGEKGLPEQFILKIMYDITKGITELHDREPPIIHRDVRVGNILLGSDGNYKLCNFGSCTKKSYSTVNESDIGRLSFDISTFTQLEYRAPEQMDLYSGYPINEKVDVWAIAVVLYNMMYFDSTDKLSQIDGIVSFPQSDRYSMPLQKLVKRLFTSDPRKRPAMQDVFRFIENLQSKILVTKQAPPRAKRRFSGFDSEDRKEKSSDDEDTKKYKTAFDADDTDMQYGKATNLDTQEKVFTGFATKVAAGLSKNGTKGWVLYATENSNFPPRIQYISKLVLKAWRKGDKIPKFYKHLKHRGYEQNTIIALKTLCLIHKYILCGPTPWDENRDVLVSVYESWAGNIMSKRTKGHKDEYRSDFFSKLICQYSEILISKYDLFTKNRDYFSQSYCLDKYFKNKDRIEGSPLALRVIRSLFNFWKQITGLHQKITQSTYLRKIIAFIAVSVLEEEYPLVCLITHLYHAFKVTVRVNGAEHKLEKDMKILDEKFIQNYLSTYLFYHKVIRMPELEDVRSKLPYFPTDLLKYFKLNNFLDEIDVRGDKGDISTFLNRAQRICGLELPTIYSSSRIVALSEFNDFNCHFEPFKDFEGGDKLLRDCKIPMPTMETLLQSLPSKVKPRKDHETRRRPDDVRLDFDEDEIRVNEPSSAHLKGTDGLQGQGEEITLNDDELADLQNVLDNSPPARPFPPSEERKDSTSNRVESADRINFGDDLVDVQPKQDIQSKRGQNRSIPRKMMRPQVGRNMRDPNMAFNQRSFIAPPPNHAPYMNFGMTPQNRPSMGMPMGNHTQNFRPGFGAPFQNVPPPSGPNVAKGWNSAHRKPMPMTGKSMSGPQAPGSGMNHIKPPTSGISPPKPDQKADPKDYSTDLLGKAGNKFATEDWFAKMDNKPSVKATEGTKEEIKQPTKMEDDSYLMELSKKDEVTVNNSQSVDPDLAYLEGLNLTDTTPKSPTNNESKAPLIREFSSDGVGRSDQSLAKESEEIKKELHFIQREQGIIDEMSKMKEQQRLMEEERKKFEQQQREFAQIKYAEQMRLKEEARRLQERQNELQRLQKINQHRRSEYEILEKQRKEEEEKKQNKNKSLEDHYLLEMSELKVEKQIGSGGSAKVYKGTYKEIDVAIKRLNLQSIDMGKAKQEFKREVSTLSKIRHPNLVLFMGVALDSQNLCIVTEFCFGGSLFQLLHQDLHIGLSWKQKLHIALDVAKGMTYLHNAFEKPILHRDLKSLNLLLQTPVKDSSDYICTKITDFGLSRENSIGSEMMTANTGTYHWMAPEVLDAKPYTHKADVYSYAIVLYEIICRTTPYQGLTGAQIANYVVNKNQRPEMNNVPEDCPENLKSLMIKCWEQDPDNRPTFSDVTKTLKEIQM